MNRYFWIAALHFSSQMALGEAAAAKTESPENRYALVGVISASDGNGKNLGMAVIKDVANGRSLNIRAGQQLPNGEGLWVSAIGRAEVTVTDGVHKHTIGYAAPAPTRSTMAEYRTSDVDYTSGYDYETLTGDEEQYSTYSYDATGSTKVEGTDGSTYSSSTSEPVRGNNVYGVTESSVDRPASEGIRDYAEQNAGKPEVVDRVLEMYREYADGARSQNEESSREPRVNHYDERRDAASVPSEENE